MAKDFDTDSRPYKIKKFLDQILPAIILFLGLYMYIEFLASTSFVLYPYKGFFQYSLLAYFVVELSVLFMMYEDNKEFFRNHWIDILLTVPFVTALKGLKSIKVFKSMKSWKVLKSSKVLKGTKFFQKIGKLIKKSKKQVKKYF